MASSHGVRCICRYFARRLRRLRGRPGATCGASLPRATLPWVRPSGTTRPARHRRQAPLERMDSRVEARIQFRSLSCWMSSRSPGRNSRPRQRTTTPFGRAGLDRHRSHRARAHGPTSLLSLSAPRRGRAPRRRWRARAALPLSASPTPGSSRPNHPLATRSRSRSRTRAPRCRLGVCRIRNSAKVRDKDSLL